jgi:hypothetical protein
MRGDTTERRQRAPAIIAVAVGQRTYEGGRNMNAKLVSLVGLLLGVLSLSTPAPASAADLDVTVTKLYCSDESGVDWWGSDEVILDVGHLTRYFSNVDTGDVYNVTMGPVRNPWVIVSENDGGCLYHYPGCSRDWFIDVVISPDNGFRAGSNQWVRANGYNVRFDACTPGAAACGWRGTPG